jgi:protein-tyrosine phosphatase
MADVVLNDRLASAGLDRDVAVVSAGTGDWHVGNPADERAVAELRRHGYRVDHIAAQVGPDHLDADLVVVLDSGHDRALAHAGVPTDRRRLLRSFDPLADGPDVADPYYGAPDGFTTVREQIEAAVPGLLEWVRHNLPANVESCDD